VQTVEDYLNYTKFNYFSPLEVAETAGEDSVKSWLLPDIHIFHKACLGVAVDNAGKLIGVSPLDCGGFCSIPD
jgi:hypothetical protein